ncbi:MAG: hypothetical protein ACOY71_08135 [Gemmatimonadota bacterium]
MPTISDLLGSSFVFDGPTLTRAIRATFERRRTPLPDGDPLVLIPEFLGAPERQTAWRAFLRRSRLAAPPDAGRLAEALRAFLGPVLTAAPRGEELTGYWRPGGPWETVAPNPAPV